VRAKWLIPRKKRKKKRRRKKAFNEDYGRKDTGQRVRKVRV
jgi:hypothetical protein